MTKLQELMKFQLTFKKKNKSNLTYFSNELDPSEKDTIVHLKVKSEHGKRTMIIKLLISHTI